MVSKPLFYLRNIIKMLIQNSILPVALTLAKLRHPGEKTLYVFADAHHTDMPFSLMAMYNHVKGMGIEPVCHFYDYTHEGGLKSLLHAISFMDILAQAKYVFICDTFLPVSSGKKIKGTKVVQLCHFSGPFKKIGYATKDDVPNYYRGNVFKNYDLVTASAEPYVARLTRAMRQKYGVVQALGVSRSDVFFDEDWVKQCRTEFYEQLPHARNKKILLWAPTFRGVAAAPNSLDNEAILALQDKLGEDWLVLIKHHPHDDAVAENPCRRSNCDIPTERILPVVDLFITDYSTMLLDYLTFDKPFVLYAPDLETYEQTRGFFVDYRSITENMTTDATQLEAVVKTAYRNWLAGDREDIIQCKQRFAAACDGRATQRIFDYVHSDAFLKKNKQIELNPENALDIWAYACNRAGIRWFLFKETLLCANGYHCLPENLSCAQIVVFGKDLPALVEQVFPLMPAAWSLNKQQLGRGKRLLTFKQNKVDVLDITVLYGVDGEDDLTFLDARTKKINRTLNEKKSTYKNGKLLLRDFYNKALAKRARIQMRKLADKAFAKLVAFAGTSDECAAYYSDRLTNKHPVLLSQSDFAQTVMLSCGDKAYPAFSGYRNYLTLAYGDYDDGLTDAVGCGLTIEDKVELKLHQRRCKQVLRFIQEISEEFNLRYYLLAGSVLGCVRHKGFIPWDDDIDLGIRIEDIKQFEAVVKNQLPKRLPKEFQLIQSEPNNGYPRMFSKICYEGRCCVDLWPLVPTYTDGFRAKLLWYFGKVITKVHYKKLDYKVTRFVKLTNLLSLFMTDRMALWFARLNERKYGNRKTPAYINLYSIYKRPKETILRSWLDTEATGDFDGITVPIVGCTEEYLTHLYGDYMSFPPPWKRASRHQERFLFSDADQ